MQPLYHIYVYIIYIYVYIYVYIYTHALYIYIYIYTNIYREHTILTRYICLGRLTASSRTRSGPRCNAFVVVTIAFGRHA